MGLQQSAISLQIYLIVSPLISCMGYSVFWRARKKLDNNLFVMKRANPVFSVIGINVSELLMCAFIQLKWEWHKLIMMSARPINLVSAEWEQASPPSIKRTRRKWRMAKRSPNQKITISRNESGKGESQNKIIARTLKIHHVA